ncbi:MAG: hypothetical protein COV44_02735 [Deltaproteobacteria bacterium CG11_big_fil_rev_8_21_14_0_20_45_16]|nr:MAG: hypothetical protein COV44_02735 [Deltaproteobacteria bacterium CG11_big_fil_rev_8_21_14_0_20_45_16]
MSEAILVLCSCASTEEAEKIARKLLEEKLAACVQVNPGIKSYYHWKEKLEHSEEVQISIKTTCEKWDALETRIKSLHSYEIPEILSIRVDQVSAPYLEWFFQSIN